jgi:phosphatidylglycerol---prolipoprotein diacylglyceryl transferase
MIPYFAQPQLSLGPITIHAFGVMVAVAMLVGMRMIRDRATSQGLDAGIADRLVTWVLLGGFAGAHLVDRLVYFPKETLADPISLVKFWDGLSSFGGFIGAIIGALLFIRSAKIGAQLWPYLDAVAYGFPFGWIFGRLGCFLAFDHPGRPTHFFLAQGYRDGQIRHNLGLDEALYTILISAAMYAFGKRPRKAGFFVGLLAVLYAPFRFALDFLRTVDVRYGGFTPGQYGAAAVLVVGIVIMARRKRGEAEAPSLSSGP